MKHFTNKWVLYGLEPIIVFWIISISETLTFDLSNKFSKVETFLTLPCLVIPGCYLIDLCFAERKKLQMYLGKSDISEESLESSIAVCECHHMDPFRSAQAVRGGSVAPNSRYTTGAVAASVAVQCVQWVQHWAEQGKLQFWLKSKNCTLQVAMGIVHMEPEGRTLQPLGCPGCGHGTAPAPTWSNILTWNITPSHSGGTELSWQKNMSLASQDGCGCEQILLDFPLLCLVAVLGYTELCCFCSQGKLALRDSGMSALLARRSMSCIIWENTGVSCSGRATNGQRNLRFSIRSLGFDFSFSYISFVIVSTKTTLIK